MFGAKVKLVSGYPGGSEVNLAVERRELDGRCGWSWDSIESTRPDWLRDRKINLLVIFALERAAEISPDVPLILDKARDDEQRQILRVHLAGQAFGRPFFAAPGIPEDRKATLRSAFDATMKDPEFVAEATRLRLEVSPMAGGEIGACWARSTPCLRTRSTRPGPRSETDARLLALGHGTTAKNRKAMNMTIWTTPCSTVVRPVPRVITPSSSVTASMA